MVTTILQQKAKATRDQREKGEKKEEGERSIAVVLLLLLFAAFDSRRRSSDLGCVCVWCCGSGIRDMPPQPHKGTIKP